MSNADQIPPASADTEQLLLAVARRIDLRRRITVFLEMVVQLLALSLAASVVVLLVALSFTVPIAPYRLILVINLIPLIVALVRAAFVPYKPQHVLLAADHAYSLHETLSAAYEFLSQTGASPNREEAATAGSQTRDAFARRVIGRAAEIASQVDPVAVVRLQSPKFTTATVSLAIGLFALAMFDLSGLFARQQPPMIQQGLFLAEEARRFAQQTDDERVRELAQQMEELGEALSREQLDPESARDRLAELGREIEEQLRNLDRNHPFENPEDAAAPPETEDTVRRALRQGMSEGDVMEFFTRMSGRGETMPDIVEALENATSQTPPDANFPVDEEALQELLSRLSRPAPEEAQAPSQEQLERMDQIVQQSASGLSELTEGQESDITGEGGGVTVQQSPESTPSESPPSPDAGGSPGEGQSAGTTPTEDEFETEFRRPADTPTLRELRGEVTRNQVMDVIIRDLPSEAVSSLSESERIAQFESVVENAIPREATPTELRDVVKSYFLRITVRATEEEGEADGSR